MKYVAYRSSNILRIKLVDLQISLHERGEKEGRGKSLVEKSCNDRTEDAVLFVTLYSQVLWNIGVVTTIDHVSGGIKPRT